MVQYSARIIFTDPLVRALLLSEKKNRKKMKCGNATGALYTGGKVSYVQCSVPASSWEALFVGFRSYLGVASTTIQLYYSIQTTTTIST